MTPTEALARALTMPSDSETPGWMDEFSWHRMETDPLLAAMAAPHVGRRLAALGYEVRPIEQYDKSAAVFNQAAEADSGARAPDSVPSAAADPAACPACRAVHTLHRSAT